MKNMFEFNDKRSLNNININEVVSVHNNEAGFFKYGNIYNKQFLNICYKSGSAGTFRFKNKKEQDEVYTKIKELLLI